MTESKRVYTGGDFDPTTGQLKAPETPPQITHWGNGLECCGELHD